MSAALVALALLAGACSSGSSTDTALDLEGWLANGARPDGGNDGDGNGADGSGPSPATLEWDTSGTTHRAVLEVPLDHSDPAGETIELALARRPASDPDQRIGAILVNPGGPGGSGLEMAPLFGFLFSADIRQRFDIVTWDPRGVGESTNVVCGDGELMDRLVALDPVPPDEAGRAEAERVTREFVEACEADSGDLLPHIHTPASARDMDLIRQALGDEQISYLGFSYGTLLGATYIELFPEQVRAFVLDGAYSRSLGMADLGAGQALGFEASIERFFSWCETQGCRFSKSDFGSDFDALIESIRAEPLPTRDRDSRDLTVGLAWTAVIVSMYTPQLWPQLDTALANAQTGDGTGLLALADFYYERDADGEYSSQHYAFPAYNCMDSPEVTDAEEEAAVERVLEAAPRVGPTFVTLPSPCDYWPVPPVGTNEPFSAPNAPPILVIATTGDPATPYEWGVRLAEELETASLLTFEGDTHTAFGGGNTCVDELVEEYLLEAAIPSGELRC